MDNKSRKRKAEEPLESERRKSPTLQHPRPFRPLSPAELSGIGLSSSPIQNMPSSQPAAATDQGPGISPYAGDLVHVYIDGLGHRVTPADVDESIGHALLHFIHTGNYETWPPRADGRAHAELTPDEIRDQYTNAVLAYHTAKRYDIERLGVWALYHMYVHEQKLAAVEIMTDHRLIDLPRGQPEINLMLNGIMLDLLHRRLDNLCRALPQTQTERSATAEASQPQPQCKSSLTVSGMEDLAMSGLPFNQKLPPFHRGNVQTVLHMQLPPINAWYNASRKTEDQVVDMEEDEDEDNRPSDWDSSDSDLYSILNEDSDTTTMTADTDMNGSDSDRPTGWDSSDSHLYSIMNEASDITTVVTETDFAESDQDMSTDWDTSDSEMFDFLEDNDSDTTIMTSDMNIDVRKQDRPADWDTSDSELYSIMDESSDTTSTTADTEIDENNSEDADYSSLDEPLGLNPGLTFLLYGDLGTTGLTTYAGSDGEGFLAGPYYRSLEDLFSFMRNLDFLLYEDPQPNTSGATPDEDTDRGEEDADYRSLDGPPGRVPCLGFFNCLC
ncbi:hypothetical protein BJX65DRAFT_315146 [Aspergillus insuetus]